MTTTNINQTQLRAARVAAILYVFLTVTAPFGLVYIPNTLITRGDATATADRFRASEMLVRLGIGSELFHQAIAIFLVLALYRLFEPVDKRLAVQVVILGALVSVPIMFVNVLNHVAALLLISGADFLSVFTKEQLDALAYLFVRLHENGIHVAAVFWGLWLFPYAMLVMRSGFAPAWLGALMIAAGIGYVVSSASSLVLPQYADAVGKVTLILAFGELPFIFWLWIWGTRMRPIVAQGS